MPFRIIMITNDSLYGIVSILGVLDCHNATQDYIGLQHIYSTIWFPARGIKIIFSAMIIIYRLDQFESQVPWTGYQWPILLTDIG